MNIFCLNVFSDCISIVGIKQSSITICALVVPTLSLPLVVLIEVVLIFISMRMRMSTTHLLFVFNVVVLLVVTLFERITLIEESLINKDASELFNAFVVHLLYIQGMFSLSAAVKIALSAGTIA